MNDYLLHSRRDFLSHTATGLGGIALAHLLGHDLRAGAPTPRPEFNGGLHHRARVKRVVQLFMNGGVSQMDTFDYKPELAKRHGEKVDFGIQAAVTSVPGAVMKSPFKWKQHGQCGRKHGCHQTRLAQITANFRQHIEQKTGDDAAEDHLLHAAETE